MAVNDPRVKSGSQTRRFQMWNTWDIAASETRDHIIGWVASVADTAPGSKLKNLVLSCHGLPGYLQLGQGFNRSNLEMFAAWNGKIGKIWLPNCLVARIPDAAMQNQMDRDYPGWGVSDGNMFCSALAKRVQCYVVAASEIQCEYAITYTPDHMTSFEGLVLSYGPEGKVTWSSRNPSTWINGKGECVPVPN
jgi:hypothetical protein